MTDAIRCESKAKTVEAERWREETEPFSCHDVCLLHEAIDEHLQVLDPFLLQGLRVGFDSRVWRV